jgi:hypothetical protein
VKKEIKIFKSFEEQETYFLEYFVSISPSDRLKALAELQKKNFKNFLQSSVKKITVHKHFGYGH